MAPDYDHSAAGLAFGGNNQSGPISVATACNAHGVPHGRLDFESETFVLDEHRITATLDASYGKLQGASGQDSNHNHSHLVIAFDPRGTDVLIHGTDRVGALDTKFPGPAICFNSKAHGGDAAEEVSPTLRASGSTVAHDNGGRTPAVAYAIQERAVCENPDAGPDGIGVRSDGAAYTLEARSVPQAVCVTEPLPFDTTQISSPGNYSAPKAGDPCHPLAAGAHPPAVVGFQSSQSGVRLNDTAGTLDANYGSRRHNGALVHLAVRRLLPVECERLQGFPDNWTLVPTGPKRKPAADGPRYKQCGNSMAVNVMFWIGARIAAWLRLHNTPAIEDLLG
jgi:DNA (cytosine-5)-methyltransferase 1